MPLTFSCLQDGRSGRWVGQRRGPLAALWPSLQWRQTPGGKKGPRQPSMLPSLHGARRSSLRQKWRMSWSVLIEPPLPSAADVPSVQADHRGCLQARTGILVEETTPAYPKGRAIVQVQLVAKLQAPAERRAAVSALSRLNQLGVYTRDGGHTAIARVRSKEAEGARSSTARQRGLPVSNVPCMRLPTRASAWAVPTMAAASS